ncbi:modular serine protease isoform X1 [Ceratitis capitata]|nr:modular serine protease isoform X1 [Ceratitis capitata]
MHQPRFILFFSSALCLCFAYEEIDELCNGWSQMKCWSTGCVKISDKCNGKRDCAEGSDETKSLCQTVICTDKEFKCDYGACVPGQSKCNGIMECWDGSDERAEICDNTPYCSMYFLQYVCIYPLICYSQQPYNGSRKLMADNILKNRTKESSVIHFYCSEGYALEGESSSECTSQGWTNTVPKCVMASPILTLDANNTYMPGSSIAMTCAIPAKLKPTITWTKDKTPLLATDRLEITIEPHTLVLSNVTVEDSGTYSCIAKIFGNDHVNEKRVIIESHKADCIDNKYFANCQLIVRANYCYHRYYQKFCCKSCSENEKLPKEVQVDPIGDGIRKL